MAVKHSRSSPLSLPHLRSSTKSNTALFIALASLIAHANVNAVDISPVTDTTPRRFAPVASQTPLTAGARLLYVDPAKGDDKADGSQAKPWRTLKQAVASLKPGDTLLLASGIYREPLHIAIRGTKEKPITIRSAPGALAIIDTGIAEFYDSPQTAWKPVEGSASEYISTTAYPNIRDVVGRFADSGIGLQTYFHQKDLLASTEIWNQPKDQDVDPIYVGPGIWYDQATGHIHARFAPTHVPDITNYAGETDPRKLKLIIAPFRATPLFVDGAQDLVIQDLVIRGAGYEAIQLNSGVNLTLEGLTVYTGTYGVRVSNTLGLKFLRSSVLGNAAPWCFRQENSLRDRPGRNLRDIARLAIHALWVPDTGREFSVYAFPPNDSFEIAYNLFCDSHDGLYLGGVNTQFHHNILENCHDDGLYVSPMYDLGKGDIYIYQNLIRGCLTPIAFGAEFPTKDNVFIYRNVFDQRLPVGYARQSTPTGPAYVQSGTMVMSDHASPQWPKMSIYQNTVIAGKGLRLADGGFYRAITADRPRNVLNNLFIQTDDALAPYSTPKDLTGLTADGNLFWSPKAGDKAMSAFFTRFRSSELFKATQANGAKGFDGNSIAADPKVTFPELALVKDTFWSSLANLTPTAGSPAIGAGVPLPEGLPDPVKQAGKPDIGAIPAIGEPLIVGPGAPRPTSEGNNK